MCNLLNNFYTKLVGRNETAAVHFSHTSLTQAHSDICLIGGVRKPLQLHCEGREAHSALPKPSMAG